MAEEAKAEAGPAETVSAPSTVPLIDPHDNRIYSVPSDKADLYRQAGWGTAPTAPEISHEEVGTSVEGWRDNTQAVFFQALKGVPFGVSVLAKTADKDTFHRLATLNQAFETEHPIAAPVISAGAGIGAFAAAGPLAGLAGKGIGLGARALGFGAEAVSAGAEAAGAAGLGADAAAGVADATAGAADVAGAASGAGEATGGALVRQQPGGPLARILSGASEDTAEQATGVAGELGSGERVFYHGPGQTTALTRTQQPGLIQAGEDAAGLDPYYVHTIEEPASGLMRTDQLVKAGPQPEITDAIFDEIPRNALGPKPFIMGRGSETFHMGAGAGASEAGAGLGADAASVGADAANAAEAANAGGASTKFSDLLSKGKDLAAKYPTGSAIAKGAAGNTVLGQVYRIDNAAIEHALDPQGQEKILFSASDSLLDAAVGAAIPAGLKGLGKALGGTGKYLEAKSLTMFRDAVLKDSQIESIARQGRTAAYQNVLYPLIGKSEEQIFNTTSTAIKTSEQGLNIIKGRFKQALLTDEDKTNILSQVEKVLGNTHDPVYQDVMNLVRRKKVDLDSLQRLGKKISDKRIVWDGDWSPGGNNSIYRDARAVISDFGSTLIDRHDLGGVGEFSTQWKNLNQVYSDNALILNGLRSRTGQGAGDLISRAASAAAAGAVLSGVGVANAGLLSSAARAGGWSVLHHVKAQHIAPVANTLGKLFQGADARISKAVIAGLYGIPSQAHKAYNQLNFDETAAAISLAGQDPSATMAKLHDHLSEAEVAQEIAVPLVQAQVAGIAHLKASLPKRNDAPDMATRSQGDPVQQHRWLEQVRTFKDPTHGIASPTADNLRILKQFYPQTLFAAQQALYTQIAKNPSLPSESRQWASKLLERPVSNLDAPTFSQTLSDARKALASQAKPGGPGGQSASGGGSQNGVQSSATRIDSLQNRE